MRSWLMLLLPIACASGPAALPEPVGPVVPEISDVRFGRLGPSGVLSAATRVPCFIGTAFGARFVVRGEGVAAIQSVWVHPRLPRGVAGATRRSTVRSEYVTLSSVAPARVEALWHISSRELQRSGVHELTVRADEEILLHRSFVVEDCPDGV